MKAWIMIGLAVAILGAGFMAGCIDEVVDPEVDFTILDVKTATVSPPPISMNASAGHHYVLVKVKFINENQDHDVTIFQEHFTLDDNNMTTEESKYLANEVERDLGDSLRIDPGEEKTFWVIFEVADGKVMEFIRFIGTLDEPVEKEMPAY